MIPIGDKPIVWHLINYSQYGRKDFILCLGYKADRIVSGSGNNVEILGDPQQDWRITMIDTGIWRSIGERLFAVREHVVGEAMFLANYSDELANVNLLAMIEAFRRSGKTACFLAMRPEHLRPGHQDSDGGQVPSCFSHISAHSVPRTGSMPKRLSLTPVCAASSAGRRMEWRRLFMCASLRCKDADIMRRRNSDVGRGMCLLVSAHLGYIGTRMVRRYARRMPAAPLRLLHTQQRYDGEMVISSCLTARRP
jgi:hypothetical protein